MTDFCVKCRAANPYIPGQAKDGDKSLIIGTCSHKVHQYCMKRSISINLGWDLRPVASNNCNICRTTQFLDTDTFKRLQVSKQQAIVSHFKEAHEIIFTGSVCSGLPIDMALGAIQYVINNDDKLRFGTITLTFYAIGITFLALRYLFTFGQRAIAYEYNPYPT